MGTIQRVPAKDRTEGNIQGAARHYTHAPRDAMKRLGGSQKNTLTMRHISLCGVDICVLIGDGAGGYQSPHGRAPILEEPPRRRRLVLAVALVLLGMITIGGTGKRLDGSGLSITEWQRSGAPIRAA